MKKSKLGYKRYSPDVNNPYNIIPSGRITMRDVDFPVYGVDDMGNAQMMYPGGEYQFPGNQVFELPIAQVGGMRRGKVDRILNENRDLNFVQRMYQSNTPSIMIPGQDGPSTHFMESADGFVYPTVVQMPDGNLQYLGEGAYDHAMETGEYIQLPNDRQARRFAKSYKKGTGVLDEFGSGGLKQWFAEKWVDVKTGKECGRSGKDKNGRPYPACRPSRRVNSTTPKTTSEMSSSEKAKFKSVKTSGQRIPYNHKRKQMGGAMTPQGISPAFFTGMKDAAVDAFKAFMASPDESTQPAQSTQSAPVDWRKMDRRGQIKYGIDQVVALEPEDRRKVLENLLESTAYMENRYGEDPRAYGRSYTSSFMSIDPIALQDMFTGRGDKGRFNSSQSSQFENFKKLNLPTSQKDFDARLREDDPVAAMAAARYRYAMVPRALPDMNNPEEMFDYWLKYYNGNGVLKHQSRDKAYQDFLKGYKMALAND